MVTLVHNRKEFFNLSVYNYNTTDYPKDKIEWVIVDDGTQDLTDLIPYNDNRIKYIKLDNTKIITSWILITMSPFKSP